MMTAMSKFRPGGESGMTLVELMVALVVLSVGLVAILNALPTIFRAAARAQSMTVSGLLAGEALAKTKCEITWPTTTFPPTPGSFSDFGSAFSFYGWRRDVSAATSWFSLSGATTTATTYCNVVHFTVRYPMMGAWKDVDFYTYIANYTAM